MNNSITDLRGHLFDTLKALKEGSMELDRAKAGRLTPDLCGRLYTELDRAKAITDVSQVLINTAKAEIDFIRAAERVNEKSEFFGIDSYQTTPPIKQIRGI